VAPLLAMKVFSWVIAREAKQSWQRRCGVRCLVRTTNSVLTRAVAANIAFGKRKQLSKFFGALYKRFFETCVVNVSISSGKGQDGHL